MRIHLSLSLAREEVELEEQGLEEQVVHLEEVALGSQAGQCLVNPLLLGLSIGYGCPEAGSCQRLSLISQGNMIH